MPGITGIEVLARLRRREGLPPIILITAFGDEETHRKARELGAVAPFQVSGASFTVSFSLSRLKHGVNLVLYQQACDTAPVGNKHLQKLSIDHCSPTRMTDATQNPAEWEIETVH